MEMDIQPVQYAFDPAKIQLNDISDVKNFSFLRQGLAENVPGLGNCIVFDPRLFNVPWPTSFPASVQCKHWKEAEVAVASWLEKIINALPAKGERIPKGLQDVNSSTAKRQELVHSAVAATTHVFPAANLPTAVVLAKANILVFMHDDIVETGDILKNSPMNLRNLLLDAESIEVADEKRGTPEEIIFREFGREVVHNNQVVGPKLLRGLLTWIRRTQVHRPQAVVFDSFADYVKYRVEDFLPDFADAALMMSCETVLSAAEMTPFKALRRLYMTHLSLTNDLYSYDKEVQAKREYGNPLLNGVKILEDALSICSRLAKKILRLILWDLEIEIDDEYGKLLASNELCGRQIRFARGIIESLAGHVFYSATEPRYARAVAGSAV